MGKFSKSQREIIGTNCTSAVVNNGNKKKVTVFTASKDAGKQVAGAIQGAYPNYKVYRSENVFESIITHIAWGALGPVGTAAGIATETWKDFTVNTGSTTAAKKLVKEINDCIAEYGTGAGADPGYYADEDRDTSSGLRLGKTAIYLIIGVVVVVAAVIIIKRKKKK